VLTDLVRNKANRIPALTGGVSTLLALIFFVAVYPEAVNRMLLAAMVLMIAVLLLMRKKYERKFGGTA
jgi:cobalamin synthase